MQHFLFGNISKDDFNFEEIGTGRYPMITSDLNFGRKGDPEASWMHSVSSYLAMFAPIAPKHFIKKYNLQPGSLICDPFSGRGTTALKAREMGMSFIGSDLNPYALVLSRGKVSHATKVELIEYVNQLENEYLLWRVNNPNVIEEEQYIDLRIYYSDATLSQLIFLRTEYGRNWRRFNNIQNIVFMFALGLMHGKMKKNGTTAYFSLDMPNTISMTPNYVRNYARKHNLVKPIVSVFENIRTKINNKYDEPLFSEEFAGQIHEHNALNNYNMIIEDSSIDLLVTSPPYLSIVNYTKSNWLKLWLLGYDKNQLNEILVTDKLNYNQYTEFITDFLAQIYPKMAIDSHVCLIVGDVHETRLIEKVWQDIKYNTDFELEEIYWDIDYLQNNKVTNMLNSKKGKATTLEKVLVLVKR